MRRRTLIVGLGSLAPAALLAGCNSSTGTDQTTGYAEGDGSYTRLPVDKRTPAKVLTGVDLDGKPLSTADAAGKIIVLNVWGSWCPPCRKEAPDLVAAAEQSKGKAVFYGINTRDNDPSRAQAYVRTFKVNYPNFYDPDGKLLLDFGKLPPKAIPSTIVIDQQGRIAARALGPVSTATLLGTIDDLVAGK